IPAVRILALARTSRCAMVGSGTRKARAISGVRSPPSVRRVSATLASDESAGWQQVKMSRSRSSTILLRSCWSGSPAPRVMSWASSLCFSARRRSRRSRSMALLRAVVVIQPPGLAGTPVRGQRSRATRKASWTASSARSKSPSTRMRVATARPDSYRKTCSTTPPASLGPAAATPSPVRVGPRWELHDRADLDRAVAGAGDPRRHFDGLVQVLAVDHVVAAELLLGLREGPVGGERPAVPDPHGGGGGGRVQRLARLEEPAVDDVLGEAVVRRGHGGGVGLGGLGERLLVAVDGKHVAHGLPPGGSSGAGRRPHPSYERWVWESTLRASPVGEILRQVPKNRAMRWVTASGTSAACSWPSLAPQEVRT